MEGQAWRDTRDPYGRMPARAEDLVRKPVWDLSRHSAGLAVRFATDAATIRARWTLRNERPAMPHMPATGVSGLDLYVKLASGWRWVANGRPEKISNEQTLLRNRPGGRRLDWPTVNLGFSGNGKPEPEMAKLTAEIDAAVSVYDSLPNLTAEEARERVERFLRAIREAHPRMPIVLIENAIYASALFAESTSKPIEEKNRTLRAA